MRFARTFGSFVVSGLPLMVLRFAPWPVLTALVNATLACLLSRFPRPFTQAASDFIQKSSLCLSPRKLREFAKVYEHG
jgi:hypothetical protein